MLTGTNCSTEPPPDPGVRPHESGPISDLVYMVEPAVLYHPDAGRDDVHNANTSEIQLSFGREITHQS